IAWSWKSVLAVGCAFLALTTSALVWRAPTRMHAIMGIAVMVFSLVRIGPPGDWTWVSFALVAITFVLLMPLVHAAIVLRSEECQQSRERGREAAGQEHPEQAALVHGLEVGLLRLDELPLDEGAEGI